jgi:hypothetical protein
MTGYDRGPDYGGPDPTWKGTAIPIRDPKWWCAFAVTALVFAAMAIFVYRTVTGR